MAEWRELCQHGEVEKLILAHLSNCGLSARMLAGVQSELVSCKDAGVGLLGEVAMEYVKKSGSHIHHPFDTELRVNALTTLKSF